MWVADQVVSAPGGGAWIADGGVYVVTAIGWLWLVDGVTPSRWDLLGSAVALAGMAIIVAAPKPG